MTYHLTDDNAIGPVSLREIALPLVPVVAVMVAVLWVLL